MLFSDNPITFLVFIIIMSIFLDSKNLAKEKFIIG